MVNRVTGMASGMDIDSIVKNMLKADSVKIDRVKQNKQKLQWKQQLYNDLNKELANFLIDARKNFGLMKTSSTGTNLNVGMSGINWHKTATSSDDKKVTATVSGTSSFSGTHKIEVERLAVGVTATSSEAIGKANWKADSDFSFDINGKTVEIKSGDNMATVAKKINSAAAGVKASYDSTLDRFFLQTDTFGGNAKIQITNPTGTATNFINSLKLEVGSKVADGTTINLDNKYSSATIDSTSIITSDSIRGSKSYGMGYSGIINIGGTEVSLSATDSISDIVGKINEKTGITEIEASYNSGTGKISFNNTSSAEVAIAGTTGGLTFLSDIFNTVPMDGVKVAVGSTESDKALANPMALGQAGIIEVNGTQITISAEHTMEDVLKKLNGAGLSASYDYLTGKLNLENGTDTDISISDNVGNVMENLFKSPVPASIIANTSVDGDSIADGIRPGLGHSGTVNINGSSFTINPQNGVGDIVDGLNGKGGVSVTYSDLNKSLSIDYASGDLDFTGTDAGGKAFMDALNIKISSASVEGGTIAVGTVYSGMDGLVKYNDIETAISSNNFTFNGINFTAKAVGEATVTVATDTEAAMEKIKKFVDDYNKIVEKMGSLIGEKTNRNYQPLTEEQKEAMTEKEVELWEERAKKGLLYRDDTINSTLSNMRGSLYDKLQGATGTFSLISEIGITTEKYSSGSVGGKLAIDEDKLRAALNSDADSVLEMLFKEGSAEDITISGYVKEDPRGIFNRISDNLIDGMKEIINRSGIGDSSDLFRTIKSNMLSDFVTGINNLSKKGSISYLDDSMLKMDKEINSLNSWLFSRENAYYARFTAMEKAMQNMASQSGWLGQQMGM